MGSLEKKIPMKNNWCFDLLVLDAIFSLREMGKNHMWQMLGTLYNALLGDAQTLHPSF